MRILHVANHAHNANGNVNVAIDLACEQVRAGHRLGYVSEGGVLSPVLEREGVDLIHLDQTRNRLLRLPEITLRLARIIRDYQADIVHAHMATGALAGYFATRLSAARLVTHIHNSFDKSSTVMRLGDRILAVSEAVAEHAIAQGMSADKVRVVQNGTLGSARLPETPDAAWKLEHPSIATLCGQHPRKGVHHLIAAFERVATQRPDARLYVAGEGPMRKDYEELAKGGPAADRITFVGVLDDPRPFLASVDVFVLASLSDPCPLVIGEARHAGCAVVATNVDGIPETLDGGHAGRLTPPADPDALAAAILDVLATPESLAAARRAASKGVERFRVERVASDVEAIYFELMQSRTVRRGATGITT